jgi:hypothetical protein
MKKNIAIFTILITLISCSPYKFIFVPVKNDTSEKLSKVLSKYLKNDELFLTFTKSYDNDNIKVYENSEIKFDSVITTGKKIYGLAKAFKVNKNSIVTIYFEGIKRPLLITKEQMKDYKQIYVSKKGKNIEIEFNNGAKALAEFPKEKLSRKDTIN